MSLNAQAQSASHPEKHPLDAQYEEFMQQVRDPKRVPMAKLADLATRLMSLACALRFHNAERAIKASRTAVALVEQDRNGALADAWNNHAQILYELEEFEEASHAFRRGSEFYE